MSSCYIASTTGTCSCGAEFNPSLLMDIEERGDHSGKPFFCSESLPQFIGTIVIGNNWGEEKREATTDEVFPSDGGLVSVGCSVWGERKREMIGDVRERFIDTIVDAGYVLPTSSRSDFRGIGSGQGR